MTEPFTGEIQIFGFGYAPYGWSFANGSLVAVRQNTALFSLYGATFGGDGNSTFALPNLVGRGACGAGQSPGNTQRTIGQTFGTAGVALTSDQMPPHLHTLYDYQPDDGLLAVPVANAALGWSPSGTFNAFATPTTPTGATMAPNALSPAGSSAAHENRQPFLALNYCVALTGSYPSFG